MQVAPQSPVANPFMLMVDPQRVLREMTRSPSLRALSQRKCHPLDRPVLRAISVELVRLDEQIVGRTVSSAAGPTATPRGPQK
jgi:hypothetical protein